MLSDPVLMRHAVTAGVIVGLLWFMASAFRKREWGMLLAQLGAAAVVVCVGCFPDLFLPVLAGGIPSPAPM